MKPFRNLATDILGTKIKTSEGEEVGVVQNMMIEHPDKSIVYIVLCYADFMGKKHRHFAISSQILTLKYTDQATTYFEIEKGELMDAPKITPLGWYMNGIDTNSKGIYELRPNVPMQSSPLLTKSALVN